MAGLLLLLAGLVAPLPLNPANAADNGAWSVTPVKKKNELTQRQFFFYEASKGQTIRDAITIVNPSPDELILDVFPSDAFNIEAGAGFALKRKDEEQTDVGSWIKLDKTKVRVAADGGRATVGFRMTVPDGVTPGDHAGGVVTLEPEPPEAPLGGNSQIQIQRALGVRMYVRVAGPLTPALAVTDVQLAVKPARLPFIGQQGGATVTYTVRNSGNVRITADRLITMKGLFGRTLQDTGQGPIPEILPGSTVTLTESFAGMPVLDRVSARVEVSEESLEVSSAGDAVAWSISIAFLVLLLLVLIAIAFAIWWSRRDADEAAEFAEPDAPVTEGAVQP
jgi:hypothetical protein